MLPTLEPLQEIELLIAQLYRRGKPPSTRSLILSLAALRDQHAALLKEVQELKCQMEQLIAERPRS